jgi:hypothetical protein
VTRKFEGLSSIRRNVTAAALLSALVLGAGPIADAMTTQTIEFVAAPAWLAPIAPAPAVRSASK